MNSMSLQADKWLKSSTFITSSLHIVYYAHFDSIGYAILQTYSNILIWMHMVIPLMYIILILFKIQADKTDGWTQEMCKVKNEYWRLPVLQSFRTVVVVGILCTLDGSSLCTSLQIKVLFLRYLDLYNSNEKGIFVDT